jgi:dTDP-4-amino-4,6-dideoxygalactose transaminase
MILIAKPIIGMREISAVVRVLRSGSLAQGPEVKAFEEEFAKAHDASNAVAVNSGTSALHLSLLAAGVGPGDEVLVPSFSFAATANVVKLVGADPVFVEIENKFFCMDVDDLRRKITKKSKAIIPVHLYGQISDMKSINEIAAEFNLVVIEDAAQSHLASLDGKRAGTWGNFACFSFYPTKNMTTGEGGMILCKTKEDARKLRLLRNQGMEKRYENEVFGFNNRMTDISAAIGRVQLRKLQKWTTKRNENANYLCENLKGVGLPAIRPNSYHSFHQFTVLLAPSVNRETVVAKLSDLGISSSVYYPTPIHRLPSFQLGLNLPVTEDVASRCLSLPVHPKLRRKELKKIVLSLNLITSSLPN